MAKAKSIPPTAQTTYALLGMRLQAIINSPKAQKSKSALLEKLPGDRPEDWDQLIDDISENDNVTIAHRDDGNIQIFWTPPQED